MKSTIASPVRQNGSGHEHQKNNRNIVSKNFLNNPKSNYFLLMLMFFLNTKLNAQTTSIDGPVGSEKFGENIYVLPNGNFVIVDSYYDDGSTQNVGAVYLYNGLTKQLISTLKGDQANDNVGFGGVTVLSNGNYVVSSLQWRFGGSSSKGAVTFCNANTGVNGVVSTTNSVVGNAFFDNVRGAVYALPNGNYVICSPGWAFGKGANTLCNGTSGRVGLLTTATSLTGAVDTDGIGGSITILSDGNYVVNSTGFQNGKGAITWCSSTTGLIGVVSTTNSLYGRSANDFVGNHTYALTNGNYVACVNDWDLNGGNNNIGAVVLCRGSVAAEVNATNAMIGTSSFYGLGSSFITVLTNGNYVINSGGMSASGGIQAFGAATWCSGSLPIGQDISSGSTVSASNSIIGNKTGDRLGQATFALTNGNYVVASSGWGNGSNINAGAVTWANGTQTSSFVVSSSNSIVGVTAGDRVGGINEFGVTNEKDIVVLSNGNYVIRAPYWDNTASGFSNAGSVRLCSGTTPSSGVLNFSNSLVGSFSNYRLGEFVTGLTNGNYVISGVFSSTWASGTTGIVGNVTASNSLKGPNNTQIEQVFALSNGNYVVRSIFDSANGSFGAATLCNGSQTNGGQLISINNSLTGSANQNAVVTTVTALTNGKYIVYSQQLKNNASVEVGAVTLGNGATTSAGKKITTCNSIIGDETHLMNNFFDSAYNYTYDYLIAASRPNLNTLVQKVFIYEEKALVISNTANEFATEEILTSGEVNFISNCKLLASVIPNGSNPITGSTTAKVWLETAQPANFVKRHFEVTPTTNPLAATGKVTLYFTQQEFNDFNAVNAVDLPTSQNDNAGIANVLIEKIGGSSSNGTGLPNTYPGSISTINPTDSDIIWDATNSRWQISFDVTGFSGFFLKTTTTTLKINDVAVNYGISIYPNPVQDEFKISLSVPIEMATAQLIDLNGRIIKTININNEDSNFNISDFSKGIYIVKIQNSGIISNHKIIKN